MSDNWERATVYYNPEKYDEKKIASATSLELHFTWDRITVTDVNPSETKEEKDHLTIIKRKADKYFKFIPNKPKKS